MTNQLVLDFKSVVGHDPNALVEVGFIISRLDMESYQKGLAETEVLVA